MNEEVIPKKRRVLQWGIIDLYETSVVGIGAYPSAHLSASPFSLVKSLSKWEGDNKQLNFKEEKTMTEENGVQEPAEQEGEQNNTQAVEETTNEGNVDETSEANEENSEDNSEEDNEEAEGEEETEKSFTVKEVKDLISKAVKEAIESSQTQRGFIETEKRVENELKDKDLGELALMMSKAK